MLRFRLRTLLIVVTLCSLLFAGYYWQRRRVEEQRAIVQALEEKEFLLVSLLHDENGEYRGESIDPIGSRWVRDILGDYYFADEVCLALPSRFGRLERLQSFGIDEDGPLADEPSLNTNGAASDIEPATQLWRLDSMMFDAPPEYLDRELIAEIKSVFPDCKLYEMRYLHWVEMKLNDEPTNNSD